MGEGGEKWTDLKRFVKKCLPVLSVLMIAFGSWLNAQGGWIKDFAQYETVNLPLLFITFSTSGPSWYIVGIIEDITGLFLGISGIYLLRKDMQDRFTGAVRRPYFIATIIVYLIFDMLSYHYFLLYNAGKVSLTEYGYVWNDSEYFVMLPMLFLSYIIMFMYAGGNKIRQSQRRE